MGTAGRTRVKRVLKYITKWHGGLALSSSSRVGDGAGIVGGPIENAA